MTEAAKPVVVCSVLENDASSTARRLEALPPGCGMVEIRADRLSAGDLPGLIERASVPVIVTARRRLDGGRFEGSDEQRREMLERALASGAAFVDVELGSPLEALVPAHRAGVILSHHGASCRLPDLTALYAEMAGHGAGRVKIVPRAESADQLLAVRDLLRSACGHGPPLACFALGRAGMLSRLLALAWGSWATYGAWGPGLQTAEGQFTAAELIEIYDVAAARHDEPAFALIGSAVRASPSPAMHMAAYRELGLSARYFPIEADRLEEILPLVGEGGAGIQGLAVTMPFKEQVAARCTLEDEASRASKSVNTVLVGRNGWRGYNTDGPAALSLIRRHLDPAGVRTAVVGAGGTSRAIAAVLERAGAQVTLYNRGRERAEAAASALGIEARALEDLPRAEWDLLVQGTPLGKQGEQLLPADRLRGKLVLDVVYRPLPTPLVRDASAAGLVAIDGLQLLVEQAVLQLERMTGIRPRAETMARAGRRWLERTAPAGA